METILTHNSEWVCKEGKKGLHMNLWTPRSQCNKLTFVSRLLFDEPTERKGIYCRSNKWGIALRLLTKLQRKILHRNWDSFYVKLLHFNKQFSTYMLIFSSAAQVFPTVVMATPAMLIKTAAILVMFTESWPRMAPKKRVKRLDMEFRTVVLATLVFASAMFEKYCMIPIN